MRAASRNALSELLKYPKYNTQDISPTIDKRPTRMILYNPNAFGYEATLCRWLYYLVPNRGYLVSDQISITDYVKPIYICAGSLRQVIGPIGVLATQ